MNYTECLQMQNWIKKFKSIMIFITMMLKKIYFETTFFPDNGNKSMSLFAYQQFDQSYHQLSLETQETEQLGIHKEIFNS